MTRAMNVDQFETMPEADQHELRQWIESLGNDELDPKLIDFIRIDDDGTAHFRHVTPELVDDQLHRYWVTAFEAPAPPCWHSPVAAD